MVREMSQAEKDKYCMISSIWVIYKTREHTQPNRNRVIDNREQTGFCQRGEGWEEVRKR